ncbi:right-handed parallel beta-helix repeat-containing protein [Spirosoma sp. KUDC1026]|uniref:right-handed parallel beta-helix repeat-containing protein n=1 Tax=Spirosoma sp. KUDC1026 TaxID=2745947 RepID=UPI00159BC046|nr:right-handed parallel beta-helix repeat-containing protein [Spirosoma sp. KUDC1026]QKZ12589.1 right-handed parallel beta-helix repeat-containing protein [Spirosoma sp. KUDC1026]
MTQPLPSVPFLRLLFFCLLSISAGYAQTVRYVKPDGSGDGSSWASASANLQAIINASTAGDQVWVAAGTYKPGGNTNTDRLISFSMKDGVAIYGGFIGLETALSERPTSITTSPSSSILSGDLGTPDVATDNSEHVIVNTNLSSTAILDGFVITSATLSAAGRGGGMNNLTSSPTIRNCYFTNHRTNNTYNTGGGGLYNDAGSTPSITNCTFNNNRVQYGTAILSEAPSLTLTNCTFASNQGEAAGTLNGNAVFMINCTFSNNIATAGSNGGFGAAARLGAGSILINCLFSGNTTAGYGGALTIEGTSTLTNCIFRGNQATGYGGAGNSGGFGGAIYMSGNSSFVNCTFSNNRAGGRVRSAGGAVYIFSGTPSFTNCSFANNTDDRQGGAIYNESGTTTLINNILWGNLPNGIINTSNANTVLTYTDTQDNTPGIGNFSLDPLFADAAGDNLRLRACSPAIDKGNNAANSTPTDLNNSPRLVRQIDLGAYEFQGTPQALVAITQQPNPYFSIPEGGTLTATVTASGSVSSYQWYKDGVAISGATSATLTVSNLNASNAGRYYVVVTGVCNSATSAEFTLVVNTGMYTVKSGRWDDASVWSMNRVPASGDAVRIKHLVTVPGEYVARARQLSYDPGQTLQLSTGSKVNLAQ